jgi:hypothetical protein
MPLFHVVREVLDAVEVEDAKVAREDDGAEEAAVAAKLQLVRKRPAALPAHVVRRSLGQRSSGQSSAPEWQQVREESLPRSPSSSGRQTAF